MSTYLSFLPIGLPASGRLVFRPIYPQIIPVISRIPSTDGDERKRRRHNQSEEYRQARERLRRQIEAAIDGPVSLAAVEQIIEDRAPLAVPRKITLERLAPDIEQFKSAIAAIERRLADDEDEEILTLLLH